MSLSRPYTLQCSNDYRTLKRDCVCEKVAQWLEGRCYAQCFVFGPPQSGKSSLLRALTKAEEATPPVRSSDVQARDGSRHDCGVTAVVPMQAEGAAGKLEAPL